VVEGWNSIAARQSDVYQHGSIHDILNRTKLIHHGVSAIGGVDESLVQGVARKLQHLEVVQRGKHKAFRVQKALLRERNLHSSRFKWPNVNFVELAEQEERRLPTSRIAGRRITKLLERRRRRKRVDSNTRLHDTERALVDKVLKRSWRDAFLGDGARILAPEPGGKKKSHDVPTP
jgi:hypothetical protein